MHIELPVFEPRYLFCETIAFDDQEYLVSIQCQKTLVMYESNNFIKTVFTASHCKNIVTAACPYPALRLDKLYAALIRCLVLWTVTKQILVFLF